MKKLERTLVPAAVVVIIAVILGCKRGGPGAQATVLCTGETGAVSCVVTHVAGNTAIDVCWDLQFDCANGTNVTGKNFCQTVQPKSTAEKRIPLTDLANSEKCDKANGSKVESMKLTALP
jgi:hypothetical protein